MPASEAETETETETETITDLVLDTIDNAGGECGCIDSILQRWCCLSIGKTIGCVRDGAGGALKEFGNLGKAGGCVLQNKIKMAVIG